MMYGGLVSRIATKSVICLAALLSIAVLNTGTAEAAMRSGLTMQPRTCSEAFLGTHDKRTGIYDRQTGTLVIYPDHAHTYTEAIADLPFSAIRLELSPLLRPLALEMRTTRPAQIMVELIDHLATIGGKRDTAEHSWGVAALSVKIGRILGLPHSDQVSLFYIALGHDLGKGYVSNEILLKPGRLTPEERTVMEEHTNHNRMYFSRAYSNHPRLSEQEVTELTHYEAAGRDHHERFDGKGYPRRLVGEQISVEARIIAIADVFQALLAERPYKPAKPLKEAIEIVEQHMRSHFDPAILDKVLTTFKADAADSDIHP